MITSEDVERQQSRERELEKAIADAQHELAGVREWLRAMAILRKLPQAAPSTLANPTPLPDLISAWWSHRAADAGQANADTDAPPDSDNLTDAIESIANGSPVAITKKELKKTLQKRGFPAERLENYFYTAVNRLKKKRRITVMSDGSVWKAPPAESAQ
jgi:hypothetical protein